MRSDAKLARPEYQFGSSINSRLRSKTLDNKRDTMSANKLTSTQSYTLGPNPRPYRQSDNRQYVLRPGP